MLRHLAQLWVLVIVGTALALAVFAHTLATTP
jgi:hypothetical protein